MENQEAKYMLYERAKMQDEIDGLRIRLRQAGGTIFDCGRLLRDDPENLVPEDYRTMMPTTDSIVEACSRLKIIRDRANVLEESLREKGFGFVKFEPERGI